jgi:hypothetical protein
MDINNINNYNNTQLKENNQYNTISINNKQELDGNIYHKKKYDFETFVANPEVEEIPTFTFENDRNLNSYKGRIYSKSNLVEQHTKNYLEYMKKFENKRKNILSSPYLVYQEKTKGNSMNNRNIELDSNENNQTFQKPKIYDMNQNNMDNNYRLDIDSTNILANSTKTLRYSGKSGEITNPDFFYQRNNKDYFKYRMEQKKYLDYNYEIIKNKLNKKKREPDINPYNPIINQVFENGKTDLLHNPILNPTNNYSYNKYLEKEVNNRYKQNINGMSHNFSTLQLAGSQLLNN